MCPNLRRTPSIKSSHIDHSQIDADPSGLPCQFPTVHLGHDDVRQQKVDSVALLQNSESIETTVSFDHDEPEISKDLSGNLADISVVIDDKDGGGTAILNFSGTSPVDRGRRSIFVSASADLCGSPKL
jgi:hypothetical protein